MHFGGKDNRSAYTALHYNAELFLACQLL